MAARPTDLSRVTRRHPCPVCGKPDWCLASPDGTRVLCMRQPSNRPHPKSGGWWHNREDRDTRPREAAPVAPIRSAAPLADPDRLHDAYTALLHHPAFALRAAHRGNLLGRGLDAAAIAANGYATMPADYHSRTKALRDVAERVGDLSGIPGAYVNANRYGRYPALAGAAGILVPVRDYTGRIRRNQVRPDRRPKNGGKYQWVSSANREGGTGSGAPLHWTLAGDREGALWVTEGPLKGDTAAHLSGHRFLCFAGAHVGQAARLVEELQAVGWPADRPLVLALDADRATNRNVSRTQEAIGRALSEAGYTVRVATWPLAVANGIDELLAAGGVPTVEGGVWVPHVRHRATPGADMLPRLDVVSLAAAERGVRRLVRELFASRAQKGVHIVEAPCGVGKTRAVVEFLGQHLALGKWPGSARVALLVDTLDRARELHATLCEQSGDPARVALLLGRNKENCHDLARAHTLGEHLYSPGAELCRKCEAGELGVCEYLNQRKAAEAAAVVVAAKQALFSEADDLRYFDLVVVDEDLVRHLVGSFELDRTRLDVWAAGMDEHPDRYPKDAPERVLVRALSLAVGGIRYTRPVNPEQALHPLTVPLRPHLRAVAEHLGMTWQGFRDLVTALDRKPKPKGGRQPFESPWANRGERALRDPMPIRAFGVLVSVLARELDDSGRADSRLWLRAEQPAHAGDLPDGAPLPAKVVAVRPRENVLDLLAGRRVVLLDATPNRWALDRLFPGVVTCHTFAVRESVRFLQLTNALHGNPGHLPAIRAWVAQQVGAEPVRLTRKADAEAEGLARADGVGWFGRDDVAHNDWEHAPALVIEGHYSLPVDVARMLVEALRYDWPLKGVPDRYTPYEGTDREGLRAGALHEADPDVAQYQADFYGRTVRQGIGRLRPSRRPAHSPALVVLTSYAPVPGVRVAELHETPWAMMGRERPWASEARRQRLDEENARRREEARQRITHAAGQYYTKRQALPSKAALAHLAGCSATTALAHLQALHALAPEDLRRHLGFLSEPVQTDVYNSSSYERPSVPAGIGTPAPPGRLPTPPPHVPARAPASGAGAAPQAHAGGAYTPGPRYTEPLPAAVPPALLAQWEAALGPPGASPPQLWADGAGGILGAEPPPGTRRQGAAIWAA